ncbi:MAG TPA: hypothetical protein PK718_07435 [Candidatus Methanofastidiosa archaeon]|nr:hypothetical protein [Candidatus Methanofastidiosa archaeon]
MRRHIAAFSAMLLMAVALSGCISDGGTDIEWTIEVYGEIPSSFSIEYAELEDMPQSSLEKQIVNGTEEYTGVSLSHIVELADPLGNIDAVNCIASDGYILTFTLSDFNNGLLVTAREGELLDEESGPVMLGFNIGCACNWMKQVVGLEFYDKSNSLGLIGDVANPIYVTIDDIRDFTEKDNDFTVLELFTKVAYYPQAQTFTVYSAGGENNYPISMIGDSTVTYANGKFNVDVAGEYFSDVESLDCVWDPNA